MRGLTDAEAQILALSHNEVLGPDQYDGVTIESLIKFGRIVMIQLDPDEMIVYETPEGREALRIHRLIQNSGDRLLQK